MTNGSTNLQTTLVANWNKDTTLLLLTYLVQDRSATPKTASQNWSNDKMQINYLPDRLMVGRRTLAPLI